MGWHAVIVGQGNTGSAATTLLARLPDVAKLTLVDPDRFELANVANQAVDCEAVGRYKVDVLRERVQAISPAIRVETRKCRVETVPLGALRADVLCCCVDNRAARQHINETACRLSMPWVNCAVGAPSLARVDVYRTSETEACMECAWDQAEYEAMEQRYVCELDGTATPTTPATGATAELGAIAAALLVNETRKLFAGRDADALIGRQLVLDLDHYARHLCEYRRNPACRLEHVSWAIGPVELDPQSASLDDLFAAVSDSSDAVLRLPRHRFVTHLDCNRCRRRTSVGLAVLGRIGAEKSRCDCGGRMAGAGFYTLEALPRAELSRAMRALNIGEIGFETGDVVCVEADGVKRYLEIRNGRQP